MRIEAFSGSRAGWAAAVRIRSLVAAGARVATAWRPVSTEIELPPSQLEFVAAHGALWAGQAVWLEWASGVPLPAVPDLSAEVDVLVVGAIVPDRSLTGDWRDAGFVSTDPFGRPVERRLPPSGPPLRIGILGDTFHHLQESPAVLARLGDAAERGGWNVLPTFVDAPRVLAQGVPVDLDGLVLPGGSDMAQVAAQMAAAGQLLDDGRAVLGLCLGMQSMTTELMRRAGWHDAMPEEIVGPGARRSFVRWIRADGQKSHRVGTRRLCPLPGSRLAALLPQGATVRMNHRFRANPDFCADPNSWFVLHATGEDGIVDAVEVPRHRFFIGLQGHPELGTDPELMRLWDAFLLAAAEHSSVP